MRDYYVYIMASPSGTLYIGVTNDVERRVWEHKHKESPSSFTRRYNITLLVYVETHSRIDDAIEREKEMKKWRRSKKVALIEAENPQWLDLSHDWFT